MFTSTATLLRCVCGGRVALDDVRSEVVAEVDFGTLSCVDCERQYPILAGVALVVPDVRGYLLEHVKGISRQVPDERIPREHRTAFARARKRIATEHIEDDLESERINALYVMNHYLRVDTPVDGSPWWVPRDGVPSPVVEALVREHWDRGPFAAIRGQFEEIGRDGQRLTLVELGCGVGGLFAALRERLKSYLGVDSSFASIALARHLALGAPYAGDVRIPEDLLQGPVPRVVKLPAVNAARDGAVDFVVGQVDAPPLKSNGWDASAALNIIDMLEEPGELPRLQHRLVAKGGLAIHSCPYIWHEAVAKELRAVLPKAVKDSAGAARWLYEQAGFKIEKDYPHLPWLFFKHVRQIELYSVNLFFARK